MWWTQARAVPDCAIVTIATVGLLGTWYLWIQRRKVTCGRVTKERSSTVTEQQLWPKRVIVVDDVKGCDSAVAELTRSLSAVDAKVVGMDCEWVIRGSQKRTRRPVSLLQLSSNDVCLLLRLHKLSTDQRILPACIEAFLADGSIAKVGVGIHGDAANLQKDYSLTVEGCLDLQDLAGYHLKQWARLGLKDLCKSVLGIEMDKRKALTASDWEAAELSEEQVHYAAADSFISLRIHERLLYLIKSEPTVVPADASSGDQRCTKDKMAANHHYPIRRLKECDGIGQKQSWQATGQDTGDCQMPPTEPRRGQKGQQHRKPPKYQLLKRPLYENCLMLTPDGQLLNTCNSRKARWYLDKGIAVMVSEQPLTVRLLREPSGRCTGQQLSYYISPKMNVCVVCGGDQSLLRKNVIPHDYRRHYPPKLKEHSSHDVLLLCVHCHYSSDQLDLEFRQHLATVYDAPVRRQQTRGWTDIQNDTHKVVSAARALIKARQRLPAVKRSEYEALVMSHLSIDDGMAGDAIAELTDDLLRVVVAKFEMPRRVMANEDLHGYQVVQQVLQQDKLIEFERKWRQRFIDLMSPRYLPPFWSVDYSHDNGQDTHSSSLTETT